jgi:WD40 repeat protein
MEKHPREDWVVFAGAEYRPRLYRASVKTNNLDPGSDPNFIREFEGFDSGMTGLAFSPDGRWLACAGRPVGEVRVHDVSNGQRKAVLRNHEGVVYGLAFSPDGGLLATAGFEGVVRVFAWEKERLVAVFNPVPPESRWISRQ